MATWKDIKSRVEENDNVLTVSMKELKGVTEKKKLGKNVVDEIKRELARVCLGHVPVELPANQDALVRLYICDSLIGELIETFAIPDEKNDQKLCMTLDRRRMFCQLYIKLRSLEKKQKRLEQINYEEEIENMLQICREQN